MTRKNASAKLATKWGTDVYFPIDQVFQNGCVKVGVAYEDSW